MAQNTAEWRPVDRKVLDYLAHPESLRGDSDVLDLWGSMTYDEAYLAQFGSKVLQAGLNGPVIGYQASLTSAAAKAFGPPDMPKPYIGTLQLRNWRDGARPLAVADGVQYFIECETGMRLKADLQGTDLTAAQARAAVATVHPALEIVPIFAGLAGRSGQHMVAIHNFGSYVQFGEDAGSPNLDLRDAPVELKFDGVVAASGRAGDSGGDPFAVLAEIANTLGRFGRKLEAGMVIMTGSALMPTVVPPGVRQVEARFGGLGIVRLSVVQV